MKTDRRGNIMTKKRTIVFIIVVALQLAVLIGMAVRQKLFLEYGNKVTIACVPVDPRSLFSGDYVDLRYEISTLNEKIPGYSTLPDRDKKFTVYVALTKDPASSLWHAAEVSQNIETLRGGYSAIIKGECRGTMDNRVYYGIEHYFVPQNEGKVIEREIEHTTAEVVLDNDGKSGLSRLLIDGVEVSFQ